MAGLVAFLAFVAFLVSIYAVIRGGVPLLKIASRKQAARVMFYSFFVFVMAIDALQPVDNQRGRL